MITVKSTREIELMKKAAEAVKDVFTTLESMLRNGISTKELDDMAGEVMAKYGCKSGSLGYYGYPGNICISVNDTLIHGIPSSKIILRDGDIVSLDVVAAYEGYYADATRTFPVGVITERAQRLVNTTRESFFEGVKLIKPGVRLGDIQAAIQKYNEDHGYSLAREYTGHGIGKHMHEDPAIPNYGKAGTGPILQEGMCLAIEPMVLEGKKETRVLGDGWTVKSRDGKLTCHYENTVVVTKDGYEIITIREGEI